MTASEAQRAADVTALQDGLSSCGFRTCRFDVTESTPPQTLLAVHAGPDDLEQLQARLLAATRHVTAPWNTHQQGWTPHPQIVVHRCRSSEAWALFQRISADLPDAHLGCGWHPEREELGTIHAGLTDVDAVLRWLREQVRN